MYKHPKHREIEAYLTGQLSKEETAAFEKVLAKNEELANEVKLQQLEHHAMDRMLETDLQSKMKSWDHTPPPNPFDNKTIGTDLAKSTSWIWWVIGAVLFSGLFWFLFRPTQPDVIPESPDIEPKEETAPPLDQKEETKPLEKKPNIDYAEAKESQKEEKINIEKPSTNKVIPQKKEDPYRLLALGNYKEPDHLVSTIKSEKTDTKKTSFEKAAIAFGEKRYQDAGTLLGTYQPDEESTVQYLRGHINFKLENYNNSITYFQAVAENDFAPDVLEAEWYLLLSYLARGAQSKSDFETLAEKLATDKYFPKQKEAKILLDRLHTIK